MSLRHEQGVEREFARGAARRFRKKSERRAPATARRRRDMMRSFIFRYLEDVNSTILCK